MLNQKSVGLLNKLKKGEQQSQESISKNVKISGDQDQSY